MRERTTTTPPPWHCPVAVENVPETGQHFDLVADAAVRAATARIAELRDLPRFEATFDVTRRGAEGLHVAGRVSATVGQNCVVTLEPITNEVEEDVDLLFMPSSVPTPAPGDGEAEEPRATKWNDPEPLTEGVVDLGAVAAEFLILGIDPYPRKAGAVFEPPQVLEPDPGPFASLASLTKGRNGG